MGTLYNKGAIKLKRIKLKIIKLEGGWSCDVHRGKHVYKDFIGVKRILNEYNNKIIQDLCPDCFKELKELMNES